MFSSPLDELPIPERVSLVKIDAEGHEASILKGMMTLVRRDRPTLIVEAGSGIVPEQLDDLGYDSRRLSGSPNLLFEPRRN